VSTPAASAPATFPPGWPERNDRAYRAAAAIVKPVVRTWFRVTVEGAERMPATGGAIVASNHRSNLDPLLVSLVTDRPLFYMAKRELFRGPLGVFLRAIGQFPVRRGGADREALQAAGRVIDAGALLGMFPEGSRGSGRFDSIHPGLAFILLRTNCPVVPVAIMGSERIRRRFGALPGATRVRLVVGPPLDLPTARPGRAGRREASAHLHQTLRQFLADHEPEHEPEHNPHHDHDHEGVDGW
jgi:1-acyl-sn-glycerol-3-phosphate acyltransferase